MRYSLGMFSLIDWISRFVNDMVFRFFLSSFVIIREGYEAKESKGKGKEKGGNQRASGGGGGGATGPYVTRVMDDAREDEMEV